MKIINIVISTNEIFCWDKERGDTFYIPSMQEDKIIPYLKKMYPTRYKEKYILLKVSK